MFWYQWPWQRRAIRKKRNAYVARSPRSVPEGAGPIEAAFYAHEGHVVHKWHHYLPLYDRYFAPFRGTKVRMLEIGVSEGGSLKLWREFFGPDAVIYGIDINPDCLKYDGEYGSVRIGSQDDPVFLRSVVEEMGGVDIILDDGSHIAKHIIASFEALFPSLNEGGIYMAEDLCCSYWKAFGGGYRRPSTFIEYTKTLIDDMHHWYHAKGQKKDVAKDHVSAIHIHNGLFVIEKKRFEMPMHQRMPFGAPLPDAK